MPPRPSRQFLLAFPLALLLAAAPATAQGASYPRVGVGVGVSVSNASPSTSLPAGEEPVSLPTPSLLIPIDVSETFRIEPVLGYSRLTTSSSSEGPGDYEEKTSTTLTSLRIGVGAFAKAPRGNDTNLSFGGRVGYNRASRNTDDGDDDDDDEEESTNASGFFIGPTVGGSYFFSDFFSIGGEVEARYANIGTSEKEIGNFTVSEDVTTITLRPSLVVRFYF
ncbi:MAG: hypothetical protein BRD37_00170 [Bacteroidetes bacterium QH_8_67_23]|nr:MAG: hypothetical protein BRD37_00170 [Bacteroidetes bacterium QH_8_67_23]